MSGPTIWRLRRVDDDALLFQFYDSGHGTLFPSLLATPHGEVVWETREHGSEEWVERLRGSYVDRTITVPMFVPMGAVD